MKKNQYDENGRRHGYWEGYYDNQLAYKGSYINGERHGYWEHYWGDGKTIRFGGNFKDGKAHGCWNMYWVNGDLWMKKYIIK